MGTDAAIGHDGGLTSRLNFGLPVVTTLSSKSVCKKESINIEMLSHPCYQHPLQHDVSHMGIAVNTPFLKETVRAVAARLAGRLLHQKSLVDKESGASTKRQKSNNSDKKQEDESQKGC